jgi:hypothetical protein
MALAIRFGELRSVTKPFRRASAGGMNGLIFPYRIVVE